MTECLNGHKILAMSEKSRIARSRVGSAEFKARCLELVDHVREAHAEYVVTRHGRPVAKLVPADPDAPASPLGAMRDTLVTYDRPFDPIPAAWSLDAGED